MVAGWLQGILHGLGRKRAMGAGMGPLAFATLQSRAHHPLETLALFQAAGQPTSTTAQNRHEERERRAASLCRNKARLN